MARIKIETAATQDNQPDLAKFYGLLNQYQESGGKEPAIEPQTLKEPDQSTADTVFGSPPSELLRRFDTYKTNEIGLPSNFHYYEWKSLRVRPLAFLELELNAQALATKNERLIIDIVQNCIDRPVGELLFQDFQFVLYWLRLNSYTKTPLIVTWNCPCKDRYQAQWAKDNLNKGPAPADWLQQQTTRVTRVMSSNLKTKELEAHVELPSECDLPRMAHYLDYARFIRENPELTEIAVAALHIKGDSFSEKLDKLQEAPDLSLYENARNVALIMSGRFGVVESVQATCTEGGCGAKYSVRLNTQLLTFLAS